MKAPSPRASGAPALGCLLVHQVPVEAHRRPSCRAPGETPEEGCKAEGLPAAARAGSANLDLIPDVQLSDLQQRHICFYLESTVDKTGHQAATRHCSGY